jgi:hypothetical protein
MSDSIEVSTRAIFRIHSKLIWSTALFATAEGAQMEEEAHITVAKSLDVTFYTHT